jgi:uncharacterized protein
VSRAVQPFHIMCKPVCGTCNLDCRYCYYTMKPRELYPDTRKFLMTEEVLADYARQYLAAMPSRCEFGWQGGEPLLAGKDFYRKAAEFQKQFGAAGQVVTNGLQTNGTLLDEEWCDFFRENKFLVGISIDGPAQVHDAHRRDKEGRPTWHRAWAGLEMLSRKGVEFNVLVTLNSANAPHAGNIYRYFVNRGVQYLQFIHILERKPGTDEPTEFSCRPEQLGRWMLDVFEQWAARCTGSSTAARRRACTPSAARRRTCWSGTATSTPATTSSTRSGRSGTSARRRWRTSLRAAAWRSLQR